MAPMAEARIVPISAIRSPPAMFMPAPPFRLAAALALGQFFGQFFPFLVEQQ